MLIFVLLLLCCCAVSAVVVYANFPTLPLFVRGRQAIQGSSLARGFLWGAGIGFAGVIQLFGTAMLARGLPRADESISVLVAALVVTIGSGIVGLLIVALVPRAWRTLVRRILPPLLGAPVEEPLNQALFNPLMRAVGLVFVIVVFYAFLFSIWQDLDDRLVFAIRTGLWSAAGLFVAVVLWRLAVRDRS